MYGGELSSPVITVDTQRNEVMIRQTGSLESAVQKTLDHALATYQRGYFELAIHQYNQAWLMDPKNPAVFNGFALVLEAQGKEDETIAIYEKCLEFNPQHAMTLCHLARQYQNKAVRRLSGPAPERDAEEAAGKDLEKAFEFYQKAAEAAKLEVDLDFIYYQWAIGLAVKRDYAGAWEKVHLAKKYGGKFIEAKFIEALTQDMPEPAPKS